jgi:hypothetical protein
MRKLAALSFLVVLICSGTIAARADDAATIAAINASSNALDDAFTAKDVETIKALMTADHITVTPYYDGPQTVEDQLDSLGDYDWAQTIVGDVDVALLGPEVAIRTFKADLKGSFKGNPLPPRVFNTETLVKRDGKWVERFYQVTTLNP